MGIKINTPSGPVTLPNKGLPVIRPGHPLPKRSVWPSEK
jgi:hypothetical protein